MVFLRFVRFFIYIFQVGLQLKQYLKNFVFKNYLKVITNHIDLYLLFKTQPNHIEQEFYLSMGIYLIYFVLDYTKARSYVDKSVSIIHM